jgi:hypothetical protein
MNITLCRCTEAANCQEIWEGKFFENNMFSLGHISNSLLNISISKKSNRIDFTGGGVLTQFRILITLE